MVVANGEEHPAEAAEDAEEGAVDEEATEDAAEEAVGDAVEDVVAEVVDGAVKDAMEEAVAKGDEDAVGDVPAKWLRLASVSMRRRRLATIWPVGAPQLASSGGRTRPWRLSSKRCQSEPAAVPSPLANQGASPARSRETSAPRFLRHACAPQSLGAFQKDHST